MKRKSKWSIALALGVLLVVMTAGCASTARKAANAPASVGDAVVDEATDTVKDIAREETRRAVRGLLGR